MARTHTTYTPEDKKSIILSILTKKTTKRTRNLRKNGYADVTVAATVREMIPYK